MTFTLKASQQFGLPNVLFWTHSACAFMCFTQCMNLMQRGLTPLKDAKYLTNGDLETIIDWIPGMKNISLRDLPGIYHTTDPNDKLLDFVVEQIEAASRASAILLPTFDALETDVLIALSTMFPKLYTIGPMELLLDHHQTTSETKFESNKCNLWKEESECLKWLDSQEQNSILYVNFGSVIVMKPEQLAWGLANSKKKSLWVIRPDLVEDEASIVPQDFVSETKERELMWGFGMLMNSDDVKRDEVEMLVKELLEGQKGKQLKTRAIEWKNLSQQAANTDGSSFSQFGENGQ
ncbi:7-deoxyloganetin glucosyltransferase [Arachis hypogaea]|nr:7-deoxyloganetin glucosyltransferase [Arachis hypogaea]